MDLTGTILSRTYLVHGRYMTIPKQSDPQFKIRLPQSLKDEIQAHASENGRSLNAEILARLTDSLTRHDRQSLEFFETFHDLALLMLIKDADLRMTLLQIKDKGSILHEIAKEAAALSFEVNESPAKTA